MPVEQRLPEPDRRSRGPAPAQPYSPWADLLRARCQLAADDPAGAGPLAGAARELGERVPLPGVVRRADRLLAGLGGT